MANNIRFPSFSHFFYDTSNSFFLGCPSVLWMTGSCRCVKRQAITWSWKFESLEVEMSLGHESFSAFRLCGAWRATIETLGVWCFSGVSTCHQVHHTARSSDFHTWVFLTAQDFDDFLHLVDVSVSEVVNHHWPFDPGCFLKGSIQNSGKFMVIGS